MDLENRQRCRKEILAGLLLFMGYLLYLPETYESPESVLHELKRMREQCCEVLCGGQWIQQTPFKMRLNDLRKVNQK